MPLDILQRAVARGFNPFSCGELNMSQVEKVMTALGHSNQEIWQMWAGEVSSSTPNTPRQDKFCPPCFKAVTEAAERGFIAAPGAESLSSSVTSETTTGRAKRRWWQFWR